MTKTKNGTDLKHEVPNPIKRLEILIDGDEDLGVKGLRDRTTRVERLVIVSIVASLATVVFAAQSGPATDTLLMALLRALMGG